MRYECFEDGILLKDCREFNAEQIFNCGQAFRWQKDEDAAWSGVAFGKFLRIKTIQEGIFFEKTNIIDFKRLWIPYFDLNRDYGLIINALSADSILERAARRFSGIRILRQEPWEVICSFIISQNNNIPRIRGIIKRLCELYGARLEEQKGESARAFPAAEALADIPADMLAAQLRCGYRGEYISAAAKAAAAGQISFEELYTCDLTAAAKRLQTIKGIGPKVAQCILLYGFERMEAFPIDVWVKKILCAWYPNGLPSCARGIEGIAQQYLYHYARTYPETLV